jgi:catechol 2,3-dioxygenase-like lactoylglutathione lyase family enzyme
MALSNAAVVPTVPASDINRAKEFYSGTLGLTQLEDDGHGVMYECGGGTKIFVYQSAGAGTSQATYASFDVADLESEMADLKAKGVAFEEYDMPNLKTENGVAVEGGMKSAWFKDSEGNILNLVQRT